MWAIIGSGTLLGMAIAILVGPVFFLMLNTALKKGFLPAFYVALGVAFSDILYILAVALGFAQIDNKYFDSQLLSKGGGILLVIIGVVMVIKKPKLVEIKELTFTKKDRLKYFSRGFLLNAINPSVIIFWIGAVSAASVQFGTEKGFIFLFFGSTVFTVFALDLLKIYLSRKLSTIITEKVLYLINAMSGICMIIYGIYLIFIN